MITHDELLAWLDGLLALLWWPWILFCVVAGVVIVRDWYETLFKQKGGDDADR